MEFFKPNDAIEGASCELYTRKPVFESGPQTNPITKNRCLRIEMSRTASAEIRKKLQLNEEEIKLRQEKGIHLEIGDKLKGKAITAYVDKTRSVVFKSEEGATHTHGGNFASTNDPTYCKIKYAFDHIQILCEKIETDINIKKIKDENRNSNTL